MADHPLTPPTRPGAAGKFLWALAGVLILAGLYATWSRFYDGLGPATNMTDDFPWGIWIAVDVLCGAALAAGGFTITGLVYLLGYKQYKPLIRPTVLTAFLGYSLLGVGLLFDVGRPWVMWHPLIYWNHHSVMFEVSWCVMLYTFVLAAESSPIFFEKLGWHTPAKFVKAIVIPLVVLGVLLSTLHQSSLGTVFLLMPGRLDVLWYTPILPILFYVSAITIAFAMVIFESTISAKVFKHGLSRALQIDLSRFLLVGLIVYTAIRLQDLAVRGVGPVIWLPRIETFFFWLEFGSMLLAIAILLRKRWRESSRASFVASCLAIFSVVMNRINVAIIGHFAFAGPYIPSVNEILISALLVTVGCVAFYFICKHLPVFTTSEAAGAGHGAGPAPHAHAGPEVRMDKSRWLPWVLLIVGFAGGLAAERYFLPRGDGGHGAPAATTETAADHAGLGGLVIDDLTPSTRTEFHTVTDPPDIRIFQTDYNEGTLVRFDHNLHVEVAECIQCHHVEACSKCHLKNRIQRMEVEEGKIALHQNCLQCHEETNAADAKDCEFCHYN